MQVICYKLGLGQLTRARIELIRTFEPSFYHKLKSEFKVYIVDDHSQFYKTAKSMICPFLYHIICLYVYLLQNNNKKVNASKVNFVHVLPLRPTRADQHGPADPFRPTPAALRTPCDRPRGTADPIPADPLHPYCAALRPTRAAADPRGPPPADPRGPAADPRGPPAADPRGPPPADPRGPPVADPRGPADPLWPAPGQFRVYMELFNKKRERERSLSIYSNI